ncbi:AAA family ATPase [Streptomyces zhihengii]
MSSKTAASCASAPTNASGRLTATTAGTSPGSEYKVRERPLMETLAVELPAALAEGRDVVLNHGLWTAVERQEWRRIGELAGAEVTLVYLPATTDELWHRIDERNQQTYENPNAMFFSKEDLHRHASRFEPPGADEAHVAYDVRSATVWKALGLPQLHDTDTIRSV